MAQFITITVEGVEETGKRLADFGRRAYKNGLSAAVRAAARVFADASKARAPKRTGAIIRSLGVFVKAYPKRFVMFGAVGARYDAGKYAVTVKGQKHIPSQIMHLVEYGHRIMPRGSRKANEPLHRAVAKEKKLIARWHKPRYRTTDRLDMLNRTLNRRAHGRRVQGLAFMANAYNTANARAIDAFKARFAEQIEREAARWSANP